MVITEFDEKWSQDFIKLRNELSRNISLRVIIQHVGSTSIPGMFAKPIIDIDIAIDNKSNFVLVKNELLQLGYIHEGDQGISGRESFKRDNIKINKYLDKISHHLYVCTIDNEEYNRHILFRDYLIKHNEIRDEYNKIKLSILQKYGKDNREKYVSVKENEYKWFFEEVINKAKIESNSKTLII